MHPDRKIGIAMGILLVGVVGALFFRNEPLETEESLSARREIELNERIQDRDVALYIEDPSQPSKVDDAQVQLDELLKRREQQKKTKRAAHSPLRTKELSPRNAWDPATEEISFKPPEFVQEHSEDSSEDAEPPGIQPSTVANADNTRTQVIPKEPSFEEYTVEFGDTLSGISDRFLGSPNRYREIYDANKDRLASPDDLKVGRALRIPRVLR